MSYIQFSNRKKIGNVIEDSSLTGYVFLSWSAFGRFERMKCFQSKVSSEPRMTIRDVTLIDLAGVNPHYFWKSFELNVGPMFI
jgi:hypothetical protein